MKINYRGYEINVKRESCLGGWGLLYYSVFRECDGLYVVDSFEDSEESMQDMMKSMKYRVDMFIDTEGASEDFRSEFAEDTRAVNN
jgi:hypothetical protein